MRFTAGNLSKLEEVFRDGGYLIRYERGNFQSGYCILEKKKVVVINKFYDTEARITSLIEILSQVDIDPESLDESSRHTWDEVVQSKTT